MNTRQYELEMYNNLTYNGIDISILALETPTYTMRNGKSDIEYKTIYVMRDEYGDNMAFTYEVQAEDTQEARREAAKAYYTWVYGEYKDYEDETENGDVYTVTVEAQENAEDWTEKEVYNTTDLTPIKW